MLENREKAFEDKFAHDHEMQFKVRMKRNKLIGLWAAEKMSIVGDKAREYAMAIIDVDFEKEGDDDVISRLAADFKESGVAIEPEEIRRELSRFFELAKEELFQEA